MIDNADTVYVFDLFDVVSGYNDRQVPLPPKFRKICPDALPRLRVETNCGLIKKQYTRIVDQRPRDFQSPLHAGRERSNEPILPLHQVNNFQKLIGQRFDLMLLLFNIFNSGTPTSIDQRNGTTFGAIQGRQDNFNAEIIVRYRY